MAAQRFLSCSVTLTCVWTTAQRPAAGLAQSGPPRGARPLSWGFLSFFLRIKENNAHEAQCHSAWHTRKQAQETFISVPTQGRVMCLVGSGAYLSFPACFLPTLWVSECMNKRERRDWVIFTGLNQMKCLFKVSAKQHLIFPAKPCLYEGAPGSAGQGGLKTWSRRGRGDWLGEVTCTHHLLPANLRLCRHWRDSRAPHVPSGPERSAPQVGACPLGSLREGGRPWLPCTKWVAQRN